MPAFFLPETGVVSRLRHLQRPSSLDRDGVAHTRLAARHFRHATPGALRIFDRPEWTEDALSTLYDVIKSQGLVFAATQYCWTASFGCSIDMCASIRSPRLTHSAGTSGTLYANCVVSVDSAIAETGPAAPDMAKFTKSK